MIGIISFPEPTRDFPVAINYYWFGRFDIENTTRVLVGDDLSYIERFLKTYLTSENELDTFGNHEL